MTNVKIDRGVAFDGNAINQGGIGNYAILINHEDLTNGVITADAVSKEIETVTLANGTLGYKFESTKGSVQIVPTSKMRKATAIDGFDHSCEIVVLDSTQLSVDNAKKLRFQKVAILIPLVNGKSMLYGRRVGMRMSDFEMKPGDADTGGSFKIILNTPENDPSEIDPPHLIASSFDITTLLT
jgi:hypothetical protein